MESAAKITEVLDEKTVAEKAWEFLKNHAAGAGLLAGAVMSVPVVAQVVESNNPDGFDPNNLSSEAFSAMQTREPVTVEQEGTEGPNRQKAQTTNPALASTSVPPLSTQQPTPAVPEATATVTEEPKEPEGEETAEPVATVVPVEPVATVVPVEPVAPVPTVETPVEPEEAPEQTIFLTTTIPAQDFIRIVGMTYDEYIQNRVECNSNGQSCFRVYLRNSTGVETAISSAAPNGDVTFDPAGFIDGGGGPYTVVVR